MNKYLKESKIFPTDMAKIILDRLDASEKENQKLKRQ